MKHLYFRVILGNFQRFLGQGRKSSPECMFYKGFCIPLLHNSTAFHDSHVIASDSCDFCDSQLFLWFYVILIIQLFPCDCQSFLWLLCFRVIPVGCDFRSIPNGKLKFFPKNSRLVSLHRFLNEKVGWMYYRSKGWIQLEALADG